MLTTDHAMWLLETLLERCWEREVPMVGGDQWVGFNQSRRQIEITDVGYGGKSGCAEFVLSGRESVEGLTLMMPARHADRLCAEVRLDEREIVWQRKRLKGTAYVLFAVDVQPGRTYRIEVIYNA